MRHAVSAKRPKFITEFSVIIPAAGSGRRMKSYGSKSLIDLPNDETVISRQIRLINSCFPKAEIIVITGFNSDKIIKKIPNVKTVENHWFEDTNVLYSIGLGMRVTSYTNVLILYGDLVFSNNTLNMDFLESAVVSGDMKEDCIGLNIDESNNVCYFDYGLSSKWCQIAFISSGDYNVFKSYSVNKDNAKLHTFEIFNKMIDHGHIFKNIKQKGKIVEIENTRDIEQAIQISRES